MKARVAAHKLVTIRFSPYNEKARWALDHLKVGYVEEPYLPITHFAGVVANGGLLTRRSQPGSSRWSTPMLVTSHGQVLHDSTQIIEWADAHYASPANTLFHERKEVASVIAEFDKLGHFSRRLAYAHLLKESEAELFLETAAKNVGVDSLQCRMFMAFRGPLMRYVRRGVEADDPEKVRKARHRIDDAFDAAADRLRQHRTDYLVGDRFSAADITFACMAAPVLFVQPWEGFGAYLPPVEHLPEEFRDIVKLYRGHPAGQFALRCFRHHRGQPQIPGLPTISTEPPHNVYSSEDDRGPSGGGMGPGVV